MTQETGPNYGSEVVEAVLDELGVEIDHIGSTGWIRAFCPFHDDIQTPSFMVHAEAGAWRCMAGCGQSRDLAGLVSRITGDKLADVQHRLKMRAPVGMESISRAIGIVEEEEEIDSSGESLFYERSRVPQYILDRGFTLDTLKEWGVGYDSITNTAVLPVRVDGKLIGLIRRKISTQDDGPKYLYTSGMRKSEVLFGLDKALKFNSNKIILVEGPLDAMWLHQYGYPAVAILGAGISQEQATLVRKHFWEVVLAFDSDSAGQKAIAIGARALSGLRTSSITLPPEKKDVQECTEDELVDVFSNTKSVWQNFSLLGTFNKYEKKSKR